MTDEHDHEPSDSEHGKRTARDVVKSMPGWKKKLIGLSLIIALIGGGSQLASGIASRNVANETAPRESRGTSSQPPAGASGFVARGETVAEPTTPDAEAVAAPESRLQRMAPHLTKIGGSFLVALVFGTIFRMFIKTAALVTAAVAGLYFGLTYFNVVDLDLDGIKTQYDSAAGWVSAQAAYLKDVVFAALPSSTSAAAGFFLGMKR